MNEKLYILPTYKKLLCNIENRILEVNNYKAS